MVDFSAGAVMTMLGIVEASIFLLYRTMTKHYAREDDVDEQFEEHLRRHH